MERGCSWPPAVSARAAVYGPGLGRSALVGGRSGRRLRRGRRFRRRFRLGSYSRWPALGLRLHKGLSRGGCRCRPPPVGIDRGSERASYVGIFDSRGDALDVQTGSTQQIQHFLVRQTSIPSDVVNPSFRHKSPVLFAHSPASAVRTASRTCSSSTATVARKALWKALRWRARSRHACFLQRYAPRPLSPRPAITTFAGTSPVEQFRSSTQSRTNSLCGPRRPHPMHWRSGLAATATLMRRYPAV